MNYRQMLLDAARKYRNREPSAPLFWLEFKNKQNLAAWRAKWAKRGGDVSALEND